MDMVGSSPYIKIVSISMIVFLCSCEQKIYKYGFEFNGIREEIGLPILSETWRLYKSGVDFNKREFLIYVNPDVSKSKNTPLYYSKNITYTNDTIICEVDTYLSGETYTTIDGEMKESLIASYYFVNDTLEKKEHSIGWNYKIFSSSENDTYGMNLTEEQADSILVSWKLKK